MIASLKQLLILLALTMAVDDSDLHAQLVRAYGLKIGVTSADQTFHWSSIPEQPSTRRRAGFTAGAYVEWFNLPNVSLLTQCEYTQRGVGEELYSLTIPPSGKILPGETEVFYSRLDYISVPVLVKIELPLKAVHPFVGIGPRFDFLVGRFAAGNLMASREYDSFGNFVLGGSATVGVLVEDVFPVTIMLEAKYDHDFTNSIANPVLTVKNNAFDLCFGLQL